MRSFALRFVLAFALLEAFVYFVLWHPRWFAPYAEVNARLVAALLSPITPGLQASGAYLTSPGYSLLVRPSCDAYQACAVLLAGILAFPAPARRKWLGAAVGVTALLTLNLLRIAALLWTGLEHPERFELMHVQVLPGIFVAAALFLLFGWALWARRPQAPR